MRLYEEILEDEFYYIKDLQGQFKKLQNMNRYAHLHEQKTKK